MNTLAVDIKQAQAFLATHLDSEPSEVALIGEGAWSRCFGFRHGDKELVIRFGHHLDDFQKDQLAYAYARPDLPIPEVVDIGPAFDGYYAISSRVHGVPLESLSSTQWLAVVPAVVSALEAMRKTDVPATVGVGGWGADGQAAQAGWAGHLLAVGDDPPHQRTHGWRERLSRCSRVPEQPPPAGDRRVTRQAHRGMIVGQ